MKHLLSIGVICVLLRFFVFNAPPPQFEVVDGALIELSEPAEPSRVADVEPVELAPVAHVSGLTEVECLAQTIFTEDNLRTPRVWIAWTVRNRVDRQIRGNTYCEVTRAPYQYSAISLPSDPGYRRARSVVRNWQDWINSESYGKRAAAQSYVEALRIAEAVIEADSSLNPVPDATHILALQALEGMPGWAYGKVADYVYRQHGSKAVRWAFYKHDTIEG